MCHRNMAFTLFHGYHLPQLSVDSVNVKKLAGGLKQIDVIIRNVRVLPTRSEHEIKNNITRPDIVSISGSGLKVVAGLKVDDPFLEIAEEQKYQPQNIMIERIDGMSTTHIRWIVSGGQSYKITIDSNKGGLIEKSIRSGS